MKEQIRFCGGIEYILSRKRVKNINMRIDSRARVCVSAPAFVPVGEIDAFVLKKAAWINAAKAQREMQAALNNQPCPFSKDEALAEFEKLSAEIFPLFADILDRKQPIIKARLMKTRWGVCHINKRSITLNIRLMEKPREAREYVVLHEYIHFVHPNHGKGFYNVLASYMPDYKQRRLLLK